MRREGLKSTGDMVGCGYSSAGRLDAWLTQVRRVSAL